MPFLGGRGTEMHKTLNKRINPLLDSKIYGIWIFFFKGVCRYNLMIIIGSEEVGKWDLGGDCKHTWVTYAVSGCL